MLKASLTHLRLLEHLGAHLARAHRLLTTLLDVRGARCAIAWGLHVLLERCHPLLVWRRLHPRRSFLALQAHVMSILQRADAEGYQELLFLRARPKPTGLGRERLSNGRLPARPHTGLRCCGSRPRLLALSTSPWHTLLAAHLPWLWPYGTRLPVRHPSSHLWSIRHLITS